MESQGKKYLQLKQQEMEIKTRLVEAMKNRDVMKNNVDTLKGEITQLKDKLYDFNQ